MVGVAGPQAQRLTLQVGDGMYTASSGGGSTRGNEAQKLVL